MPLALGTKEVQVNKNESKIEVSKRCRTTHFDDCVFEGNHFIEIRRSWHGSSAIHDRRVTPKTRGKEKKSCLKESEVRSNTHITSMKTWSFQMQIEGKKNSSKPVAGGDEGWIYRLIWCFWLWHVYLSLIHCSRYLDRTRGGVLVRWRSENGVPSRRAREWTTRQCQKS